MITLSQWCNGVTYSSYRFNGIIYDLYGLEVREYWVLGTGLMHSKGRNVSFTGGLYNLTKGLM